MAWFAAPAVLCEIVILAFKRPRAARLIPFRYVIDTTIWWSLVREAVPISVGTALATVYYRLDSVMLSKLDTFESVAAYGIAYKFVDLAHFVSTALSVPILTLLVKSWPDDLDRFRDGVRRGVSVLAVAATIVIAEIVVFAHQLMAFLYRKYVAAASATKVLVLAECVGYFGTFAFSILLATGRHRRYPLITAVGSWPCRGFAGLNSRIVLSTYSISGSSLISGLPFQSRSLVLRKNSTISFGNSCPRLTCGLRLR